MLSDHTNLNFEGTTEDSDVVDLAYRVDQVITTVRDNNSAALAELFSLIAERDRLILRQKQLEFTVEQMNVQINKLKAVLGVTE